MPLRTTLNLLSPAKKTELRNGAMLAAAQSMCIMVFAVSVCISGIVVAAEMHLRATYRVLKQQTEMTSDEYSKIVGEIDALNDYLKRIDGMQRSFFPLSRLFTDIAVVAPPGVRLTSMAYLDTGTLTVSGIAAARSDVLAFKSALEKIAGVKSVTSPLSNILQRTNVQFDFEVAYRHPSR